MVTNNSDMLQKCLTYKRRINLTNTWYTQIDILNQNARLLQYGSFNRFEFINNGITRYSPAALLFSREDKTSGALGWQSCKGNEAAGDTLKPVRMHFSSCKLHPESALLI